MRDLILKQVLSGVAPLLLAWGFILLMMSTWVLDPASDPEQTYWTLRVGSLMFGVGVMSLAGLIFLDRQQPTKTG